jgi:hypothetical protein
MASEELDLAGDWILQESKGRLKIGFTGKAGENIFLCKALQYSIFAYLLSTMI